jgi:hypothetical protein
VVLPKGIFKENQEDNVSMEKTVTRLNNGNLLKGYMKDFSPDRDQLTVEETEADRQHLVNIGDVKAVFFVKSFEGDHDHRERKSYGIAKIKGQRVFVKFRDGESMVGFLEGEVPWERGFFLSKQDRDLKGFFLLPVDEDANNIRVFVVASSVDDVTVVPNQVEQS